MVEGSTAWGRRSSTAVGADGVPARIGDYDVVARVGAGAQSEVFAVRAPDGATIALKWMREGTDPRRVQREVRVALRVRDPRVVGFRGFGVHEGRPFITMELLEGASLARAIEPLRVADARSTPSPGGAPAWKIAAILADVADGLAAMHDAGLVHRDLKPENVCVDRNHRACIVDLGLAKPLDRLFDPDAIDESITHGAETLGTVRYMAPEQLGGEEATPRSDLYALGVILFEALTGKPPYDGPTPMAVALAHLSEPVPTFTDLGAAVPPALRELIGELLAKDPRDRPTDAREVARRLRGDAPRRTPVAARLAPPSLEGRAKAMERARGALTAASGGAPQTLVLVGALGTGKTRLLEEISRRARGRGFVTASSGGKASHPIDALLLDLVASLRELGGREAVDAAFAGGAAAARERIPELDVPSEAGDPVSAPAPAHRLADALRTLVRQVSAMAPLLIAVDDAHLVDEDGCRALAALADVAGGPRLMLALSFGDAELARSAGLLVRKVIARPSTVRIDVEPLQPAEIAVAIASMLGVRECPAGLVEHVGARANGNPFVTRELVQAAFEQGALTRGPDGWRFDTTHAAALPATVAAVVAERMGALPDDQRTLAEELAIVGDGAPHEVLATCTRLEEGAFLDALDGLLRARVVEERSQRRGTYAFTHATLGAALLDALDEPTRRAAHARVAARLVAATGNSPSFEVLTMIAGHQETAGDADASRESFLQLTRRALRRGDGESALRALQGFDRNATESRRGDDDVIDVRAQVARLRGELKEAERLLRTLIARADPARRAEAYVGLAAVFEDGGRHRDVVDATEAALAAIGAPSIPRGWLAVAYSLFSYVLFRLSSSFVERPGAAPDVTGRAYAMASRASYLVDRRTGVAAFFRFRWHARRHGIADEWICSQAMMSLAMLNVGGVGRAALTLMRATRPRIASVRDAHVRNNAGYALLAAQALAGPEIDDPKLLGEVETFAQVIGDRQTASCARGYIGYARFQRGELDGAQREVLRHLGDRSNDIDLPLIGMHHKVLSGVVAAKGERRAIADEMRHAEAIAGGRAAVAPHDEILAALAVCTLAMALDDPGTAVMWARRACERAHVAGSATAMSIEVWGHYLAARALDGIRSIDRLDRLAVQQARRAMRQFRAGSAVLARGLALWAFATESPYEAAAILDDEQHARPEGWAVYDGAINDLCAARFLAESDHELSVDRAARGGETLARIGAVAPPWLARLPARPAVVRGKSERAPKAPHDAAATGGSR